MKISIFLFFFAYHLAITFSANANISKSFFKRYFYCFSFCLPDQRQKNKIMEYTSISVDFNNEENNTSDRPFVELTLPSNTIAQRNNSEQNSNHQISSKDIEYPLTDCQRRILKQVKAEKKSNNNCKYEKVMTKVASMNNHEVDTA